MSDPKAVAREAAAKALDLDALEAKLDEVAAAWVAATFGVHNLRSPFTWGESASLLRRLRAAERVCELAATGLWVCESPRTEIVDLGGHVAEHGCHECGDCQMFDALTEWEDVR